MSPGSAAESGGLRAYRRASREENYGNEVRYLGRLEGMMGFQESSGQGVFSMALDAEENLYITGPDVHVVYKFSPSQWDPSVDPDAFVPGELVARELPVDDARGIDLVELRGLCVQQERAVNGGLEGVVRVPADGRLEAEPRERAFFLEPREEAQREAAAGPLVAVGGRGEDQVRPRVLPDELLQQGDRQLGGLVDEEHAR